MGNNRKALPKVLIWCCLLGFCSLAQVTISHAYENNALSGAEQNASASPASAEQVIEVAAQAYGDSTLDFAAALVREAEKYYDRRQDTDALALQRKALEVREKLLRWNDPQIAEALQAIGNTYDSLGQYEEARVARTRALKISEDSSGPASLKTARSLNDLALSYLELGKFQDAIPLLMRAISVTEKILGPDHPDLAPRLGNLASSYLALGQYDRALPLQNRVLMIRERTKGAEHPDTATSLNNIAITYQKLGQFERALPLQERALSIMEKFLGSEDRRIANYLANLAATHHELGRFDQEITLQKRALSVVEKSLNPDHPLVGRYADHLATAYRDLGQYPQALELQLRALKITERALGPEHPDTGRQLSNLASTYWELGQFDQSQPLQARALAITEKAFGPEHEETALAINNLGEIYFELGKADEALKLQLRALELREKLLGPEHPATASSLNYLAKTYFYLEDFEKSITLQKRALTISEKSLGPDHPEVAYGLTTLAEGYLALERYAEAYPLQQRALSILEAALGPDHPNLAVILDDLAISRELQLDFEGAASLQERALAIREAALGTDNPHTAFSLSVVGRTKLQLRQSGPAITLLKMAVNSYQRSRENVSRLGKETVASYTQSFSSAYEELAVALTDEGRLDEAQLVLDMLKEDEHFEFIRRSSEADPRRTFLGYTDTEKKWMARYREISGQLAALGRENQELTRKAKRGLTDVEMKRKLEISSDLKIARAEFSSFLDEIQQEFLKKGATRNVEFVESSKKSLAQLQSLIRDLGEGAVLLQVYISDSGLNFLLTTPGVQIARRIDINPKELNRKIAEFRSALRDPNSNAVLPAQAMYRLLLAPVEADLVQAGAKTVMLSLDGNLRYVPFSALHDGEHYALARWNFPQYSSVARDHLRDAVKPRWQVAGLGVTRGQGEFRALPAVRAEMASIVRSGTHGILPGEVHLDESFTASRLRDVTQRRIPVVHVASHFRFIPGTEVNSFLLLGDGTRLTLQDIRTQNYRFDDVDLLTLSACDTGLGGGRDERGKEIEGFGVIAQQQGAKAVIATLWAVEDQSTAVLMADMYRKHLSGTVSKVESLRQAQLSLQAKPKYRHPYYWAPFTLMGNWK